MSSPKEEKRPHKWNVKLYLDFYFHFLLFIQFREKESLFVWNVVTDPIRNSSVTIDWSTLRVIVFWIVVFLIISKSNVISNRKESNWWTFCTRERCTWFYNSVLFLFRYFTPAKIYNNTIELDNKWIGFRVKDSVKLKLNFLQRPELINFFKINIRILHARHFVPFKA